MKLYLFAGFVALGLTSCFTETETTLQYVSGNNQNGEWEQALPEPLRVQIVTDDGGGVEGESVSFHITSGGGSLGTSNDSIIVVETDTDGYAETSWILGVSSFDAQSVEVSSENVNTGSPISFVANEGCMCGDGVLQSGCEECDDGNTSDADGCSSTCEIEGFLDARDGEIYQTVTIGNQTWFAENLRYETTTGSWYNTNNPNPKYGRLYDWQTAMTACPAGWHLPSDAEWNTLEIALGMDSTEANLSGQFRGIHGTSMKSLTGWDNNGNGDNSSGFNVFPTGAYGSGSFYNLGGYTYFWSTTEHDATSAWARSIGDGNAGVFRGYDYKTEGSSCRCLRD